MVNFLRFNFSALLLLIVHTLAGQAIPDTSTARQQFMAEIGGIGSSASQTPFWFRSRQYGIVPLSGSASLLRVGFMKQFGDGTAPRKFQTKVAIEGVANIGASSRLVLPVAYASVFSRHLELYAGRRREVFGLVDTLLSSGSYAWSGNALPLYKIQLATRGYVPLGFTKGVVAINALYAHGWFSNTDSVQGSFLHQKAVFFRINLFRDRVKLYGGLTHYAQWGGRSKFVNNNNLIRNGQFPSSFQDYLNVVLVRDAVQDTAQYSAFDLLNKVGNHLGSIDMALELDNDWSNWYVYYQHPYEDKSGVVLKNMPDGLYGVRWKNKHPAPASGFQLRQVTAEFLTTMDQSGFNVDLGNRLYQGADDYFNNGQFINGWTHRQRVIGSPFMTRWQDSRPDLRDLKGGFGLAMISNNRVQMGHLGLLGQWGSGIQGRVLLSYSQNFGRPIVRDPRTPFGQFSGLGEVMVPLHWAGGTQLRVALAIDQGNLLTNNTGGWISLRKVLTNRF
jgi:hypothetical protein